MKIVSWRGRIARYTEEELEIMRRLREAGASKEEIEFIHVLKAEFGGTIREGRDDDHARLEGPGARSSRSSRERPL